MRIGVAGWSYPDWEGRVYPRHKTRAFQALAHVARFVDFIEINVSFYRPLEAAQSTRWLEQVALRPGLRFAAKLHQSFTHEARLAEALGEPELARAAAAARLALEPLERAGRLYAELAQFPHTFVPNAAAWRRLEFLRDQFEPARLVFELRHRSWYDLEALRRLTQLGVTLAWLDLPTAPDHAPPEPPATGPLGYLRLHGRNRANWFAREAGRDQRYDWLYDATELQELAGRARRLAQRHDQSAVVGNNHFQGKALVNALELLGLLRGTPVDAPAELVAAYPRLATAARACSADGQASLFV